MEYNFYFDESFHDRKMTLCANGRANTMQDAALDSYVGVFWGCRQKDIYQNKALISDFEEKEKLLFGLKPTQELKSSIIPISQYKYGIRSLNKNAKKFTTDLFKMLDKIVPFLQINVVSKFELLWRSIFDSVVFPININSNLFFYSLTKFTIEYRPRALISAIFDESSSTKTVVDVLKATLNEIVDKSKSVVRKERETEAFMQIIYIVDHYVDLLQIKEKYKFSYAPNFEGFLRLLKELSIDSRKCKLVIDRDEKTYLTARNLPFRCVRQADSVNSLQLHLADYIGGFVGRMMYCLSHDSNTIESEYLSDGLNDIDFERKRLLSSDWFNLSEQDYNLYLLIYKTIIVDHQHYWTTLTLSYCDQIVRLYSLLRYIASYSSYSDFCNTSKEMHSEYYNSACCRELDDYYKSTWKE